jgi:hypothetical protein
VLTIAVMPTGGLQKKGEDYFGNVQQERIFSYRRVFASY